MTDRAAAPTERATACPFVAFEDERDERSDRPDHRHRCYAESKPAPRAIAHQEAFCLSPQFAACPTFQDWARREAAHSATSRSTAAAPEALAAAAVVAEEDDEGVTDQGAYDAEDEGDYGRPAAATAAEPSRSGSRDWAAPPPWVVETAPPADAASGSGSPKSGGSKKRGASAAGAAAAGAGAGLATSRWLSDEPFDDDAAATAGSSAPSGKAAGSAATAPAASAAVYDPGSADAPQTATPNPELAGLAAAGASRTRSRSSGRPPSGQAKAGRRPPVADDRGPSWERPRRFEAYPSLRTRVAFPAVPRVLLALVGLGFAAVILFMVPSLFFSKGDQGGTGDASPSPSALPSASVAASPVPAATPLTYTVQPGDNLGKIARKFKVTQQDILKANPKIKDPNKIAVGQVIVIPTAAAPTEVIDSGPTSPSPQPSSAAP